MQIKTKTSLRICSFVRASWFIQIHCQSMMKAKTLLFRNLTVGILNNVTWSTRFHKKADLKENNFAAYFFIFLRMLYFQIPYTIESAFFMGEKSKFP